MSGVLLTNRTESKVNRTCEGCRKRKVKCIRDGQDIHSERCERCTKLELDCVFNAPAVRRKRRRNETHIRQLEARLDQVWKLVSSEKSKPSETCPDLWTSNLEAPQSFEAPYFDVGSASGFGSGTNPASSHLDSLSPSSTDPIAFGLVDELLCQELCVSFCTNSLPYYPFVFVPNPHAFDNLRKDRPALFRAILAAGSACSRPEFSDALYQNAEQYVTEQVVILGKKSLDLVQAALVLAVWSRAPARFEDLNFGQFANIAASIVMDLRSSNNKQYKLRGNDAGESQLEVARTFAASYFLCSSIAMSYRRPTTLRYGSWVQTCAQILETGTESPIGDRRLAEWTRLQRLAEEGLNIAGLDDEPPTDPSDDRSRAILDASLDQVKRWSQGLPSEIMTSTLSIHYNVILLNLSVPGLHTVHESQDFRPPFAIRHPSSKSTALDITSPTSSFRFINSRTRCLEISRKIVGFILTFSIEELQRLPVIVFTRLMYAAVVIIKLDICKNPNSSSKILLGDFYQQIGLLDPLYQAVEKLSQASESGRFRIPTTFSSVLQRMVSWCNEAFTSIESGSDPEVIEPLKDLNVGSRASGVSRTCAPLTTDTSNSGALSSEKIIDGQFMACEGQPTFFEHETFTAGNGGNVQMEPTEGSMTIPCDDTLLDEYFNLTDYGMFST